ncbi:pyridoxal 5'-phosphate synthase glutaminase subunit PdxT [Aeromicrobium duanguangcaii]|uniref:Pyridoxal 5'-phosphate synthase subunit PdxT n=1 Tax=Aeromicrobium duanguangcaii TaxID=2968086 RepID=A0ABY5KJ66_9ACTN|nr:pyridoxal 5'-phosphate synthase glutaminase subunit PdxT [Aeromicrobium duanguangcaii]MCD9153079.1 pyridoxal 5'-phosphate synthase glutaminase subunit PdxT [Aeromicrobium duanguangcaii]UUI69819.1 pyridoxal 5'-phosphate synthase glutaminase subunit PdxT [Aeromicrobium duanguangcaii]
MNAAPTVGVFALQGDVREHLAALDRAGVHTLAVRRPEELARCHALVLPGGESTTMSKLARIFDLFDPLAERIRGGMPTFGTCAGMIMLAEKIEDGIVGQETFGGLDIVVRRNAFGRQVDSFETELEFTGMDEPVHAVFIRAPWVESAGSGVEVLARVRGGEADGRIVAVRQRNIMATSFHPEMAGDDRVHRNFVEFIAQS